MAIGEIERAVYVVTFEENSRGRYKYQGVQPLDEDTNYQRQITRPWLFDRPWKATWPDGNGLEIQIVGSRAADITVENGGIVAFNDAALRKVESCVRADGFERLPLFAKQPSQKKSSSAFLRLYLLNITAFEDCLDLAHSSVASNILYTRLAFYERQLPSAPVGLFKIHQARDTVLANEFGFSLLNKLKGFKGYRVWSSAEGPLNIVAPPYVGVSK